MSRRVRGVVARLGRCPSPCRAGPACGRGPSGRSRGRPRTLAICASSSAMSSLRAPGRRRRSSAAAWSRSARACSRASSRSVVSMRGQLLARARPTSPSWTSERLRGGPPTLVAIADVGGLDVAARHDQRRVGPRGRSRREGARPGAAAPVSSLLSFAFLRLSWARVAVPAGTDPP